MKTALQKFGKFLSAMVMPNIGAFIAWGFITAIFIADGWWPNEQLASIQPYMLTYLLPILIAATGGRMIAKDRGMVMGAIAIVGCIAGVGGTEGQPMLMAAMIMGPFAGWVIKKFDQMMEGHMPAGFEMLINNFSVGILGMILAIIGYYFIGPVMTGILSVLSAGVALLINNSLLPLVAIFVEPAKVLFLNNAINHGIFTPIGVEQAVEAGKSIMYMLESNPGPGLGVLLAYWLFSADKTTKDSAPGAIIIHFLGGIHEIYFPYILMNPVVIIAPILGNICAITFYTLFNCGLKGPASPGSIIAYLSMAPKGETLMVLLGVLIAAGVSFLVASPIIKLSNAKGTSLEAAKDQMQTMKAQSKGQKSILTAKKIVFACDAGMGSSAMGATKFRNRLKAVRPDIVVTNTSVDNIPSDCDIAVVQTVLADRARECAPNAVLITIGNFLADPALDDLFFQLSTGDPLMTEAVNEETETQTSIDPNILVPEGIILNQKSVTKEEAITAAGQLLTDLGYVDKEYIPLMLEREKIVTTYIGMGLAIPHGTTHDEGIIHKTGIVLIQYPEGIDFGDEKAQLVIGIAGKGGEHMEILSKICTALEDETILEKMKTTDDKEWIMKQLS
ncbi:PTS mannitol transporter subunit IICBA [Faecalitalea cylindroides]|uniref:Mannitol-specific phosphotransferase enzyme IIA component n=2 Tax=Faecalitalea cylindroides TaxID=39483 RepID=A0A1Y4LZ40_9FIRM|nr:PTS mannitol transporter subunit IICBA [Faecalitalea cylindroides]ERK45503.1 putative EIICBA-Mtl [[Eubacterium] cylindroides ATCC 27803] [Faecalitalea cylindroides ATCC 27803]MBM6652937.1 PTS mannitol transporter subunit IICBA [Faecalitalea cylindroides]MBM6811163.1 PTS mannitol transporter subunit IICBA [Faecalitalea cylindroides]MDB7946710.1 PTS mannitol transporter subunit IICBA [Faecalitalea cylindroides]MDB7948573.1 PTS mannitol transporter subunit IICBA [Faecalitalea cylindroides]